MAPIVLLVGTATWAQSPYYTAITNLNPIGYWPMHEVQAAASGDIETNYGTLGILGNGFYPDWAKAADGNRIKRGVPGALANDSDTAVSFTVAGSPPAGTFTNVLFVPHTSPLTVLKPPFSVECWLYPTNQANESVWSASGFEGLNAGGTGGGGGSVGGMTLQWNGTNIGFQVYNYNNSSALLTEGHSGNTNLLNNTPLNQWYHVVVTCDANTNVNLWVNGIQGLYVISGGVDNNGPFTDVPAVALYTPDYWSPMTIGGGRGDTRVVGGSVDEFAVYTNVITDITTHYSDGISGGAGAYFHDVTNDQPTIYLRMDAPGAYTAPSIATWPVLYNYGATNGVAVGNGVYNPGTAPGAITGPITNPNGAGYAGLPGTNGNVAQLSGISSFADAGNPAAYNPTGPVPFSVSALFKGNPCDGRVQTIIGHSDNSWRVFMNNNGTLQCQLGTNTTSLVKSVGVYNDGNWHQLVTVYAPGATPTTPGTNALFVDGLLDGFTNNVTTNGILPGTNLDVMIGADPQYTNNPPGPGRQFAGKICEVVLFGSSLTVPQVQTLYSSLGVLPYITAQPATGRAVNGGTGTSISFNVAANGSSPLAYQWYFNNSSNYTGATKLIDGSRYTNSATSLVTLTNLVATDSGYYYVVITNNYGAMTSSLASLTVFAAPAIARQIPVPYTNLFTLYAAANPAFSVSANGALPLYYYWFTNGVPVSGATNSSFTWLNPPMGLISNYCVVSNVAGSITSSVWGASVIAAPVAPYPTNVLAAHPLAYWRLDEGPDDGNGNPGVICHDYAGGNDGIYTNVVLGQTGYNPGTDSETSAEFGEFGSLPAVNEYVGQIQGADFAITNGASANFTVEAWVNGLNSGLLPQVTGAAVATKGLLGVNDQFNLGIDSTKTHYRFYVRDASGTIHTVGSGSSPALDNSWHHLVGVCDEANGLLSLYYDGRPVNTAAIPTNSGVYSVSAPMTIGAATVNGINYTNQFIGNINDVAVYNYALSFSEVTAQYSSLAGIPPYFTQPPPASPTVNGNGNLVLAALAGGTTPLGYYWTDVSAATNVAASATNGLPLNATLTVSNVPAAWNTDQLELTVSNAYGTTNFFVSLTVFTNAPQITRDIPSQVKLLTGKSYTYSVTVVGPPPYGYQWYNVTTPITGQTNPAYATTAGSSGSSTTYYVVITNIYGATTSSVSMFTPISQLTNPYATNLLASNPVGYWPLQETNPPAPANIETNYGTLGTLGNAFYAATNATNVHFAQAGALAGDSDTAIGFTGSGSGTPDSYAFVPRLSPALTLRPPLSLEAWVNAATPPSLSSLNTQDMLGEGGSGLNSPANSGNFGGIRLAWDYIASTAGPGFGVLAYNGSGGAIGVNYQVPVATDNQWYHCVVTYDGTTATVYVDGALISSNNITMAVDTWTPLTIAGGRWQGFRPTRALNGLEDEVAIYTNVLTADQVTNHWLAGTTVGSNYMQTVQADRPLLYYRMDAPAYTNPSPVLDPFVLNYGSAQPNGAYPPGTVPGEVSGPSNAGWGAPGMLAAAINGITACVDAGSDGSFNPTGTQPFTAMAWFKTYPSDGRVQAIMSHGGSNSWALTLVGTNGTLAWSSGAGSVSSTGILNDNSWHFGAGVFDGANNYLYVDGALNNSASASGGITGNANNDLLLGGDPDFIQIGANQRYFAGAIAQAAFFTNALSAAAIQQIYKLAVPVNTNPTNIVFSLAGNQFTLSWPADHIGWRLQARTNSLVGANWFDVPNASSTNQVTIPINPANGTVFYRLIYP
jgi:hypothetical protein